MTQKVLNDVNKNPERPETVITGDEPSVNGYDVESKTQPSQWKLPEEP